jgi:hypothetical protein
MYGKWVDGNCRAPDDTHDEWRCGPEKEFQGTVIAPSHEGRFRIWIYRSGARSACEFDGVGGHDGQSIVATATDFDKEFGACEVTVTVTKSAVSTQGNGNPCSAICGSWINAQNERKLSSDTTIPPRLPRRLRKH